MSLGHPDIERAAIWLFDWTVAQRAPAVLPEWAEASEEQRDGWRTRAREFLEACGWTEEST
jgi:hypothetical protein